MKSGHLYLGGVWREGRGAAFTSQNPATQADIWQGNAADVRDVDLAVTAARQAFPAWAALAVDARIAIIERYKTLLTTHQDDLAKTIAEETGKILSDSKGEAQTMVGKIAISIDAYHARTGVKEIPQGGMQMSLRHKPHGVMAVYGPYNFPGHLPNGHIVPALIAGNTIVFKPSEQTPLVAEKMTALWEEAGLPAGVLNLVQGARDTGVALAGHDGIDGVLFTGSAEVGALLHKQFGGHPEKMLALEMGGNNPLVIFGASNSKAAALIALQSAFLTTGQRCTCARRLILPKGAQGDAVLESLIFMSASITPGGYMESPEPFMGPLISNREADKLLAAQDTLEKQGGKVLLRMRRTREGLPFVTPAIIDVTSLRNLPDREYFGPLLQVIRVEDFAQALQEANNTRLGLSAALVSDDAKLWGQFLATIRAGIVNWNRPTNGASGALPFGGIGASGNHRPSAYYAADYCAYPVSSMSVPQATLPDIPPQGIKL